MEYNKILIRYAELVLKGKNRSNFINQLERNIKKIVQVQPETGFDRMYIPYSEQNLEKLNYIFGISSFSPVYVVDSKIEKIEQAVLNSLEKDSKTFKIAARRNDKKFELTSDELNRKLGGLILKNTNLTVDVHDPDQIIYIEVRKENTYIFSKYYEGLGGLPVGSSGRILHLISGGIDSPVSAFKLMKRGLKVEFLTFITPPQTDEKTVSKIRRLVQTLTKYQGNSSLIFADYSQLMNYLAMTSNQSYKITLMRRSFYRIAQEYAIKNGFLAISNGDNLGQVASQTIESLVTIGSVTKMQIFRPLLTYDKNEIIEVAQKIGTYDISIEKANETCELFAPKNPTTKPSLNVVENLEKELNLIPDLENDLLENGLVFEKIQI
ncbi:tRNA uracil 4-sulfurtransferase ThiI [Mycoplasmopsis pullorum]|uniref:Probable tRNA sulfurtransferase n=1 Tax=Mycoplasmopsis pullorum TaxID=48003 RepID=A0A1L4FSA0_9BACT|nr:tRNA uracil 4-sulfurtransferase ThiI [Mycoplasmopsis pullorum]APJ38483.1 tRNA 4-thiouridine(8) synthase ThiI [Mycoplasmopsis pullorum]TNK82612.1 tRNA 4-thiouridine(8) synthase ThiI [Mycoplasmopsis pullorum]TNK83511.1 tRNA 4-thiouridine(8) synthase ThiI [Mycoplasmopsis pullorum]TNK84931.1 tRNA 4-thiouridine(8) synthase ThiI [Mycoplasmopsis pullorum]TNK85723.1 tRNA 4-thiouridine(8) synthase ThiI [Mycoplasmopsis pullorum]